MAVGGAGTVCFGMNSKAITKETLVSSAGAWHNADGQNVATLDGSADSLWLPGFDTRLTALSAPAT